MSLNMNGLDLWKPLDLLDSTTLFMQEFCSLQYDEPLLHFFLLHVWSVLK